MSSKKPTRASVKRSSQEIRHNHTTTTFTPPAPAELQEPHQHQQSRKDNSSLPDRISSNHNASLGTERSQELQAFPSSNKKKYLINLQANGSVIEKDEVKWSTTCGKLIRNHVPIGYDDWRHVDKVYKDSLWTYLMAEFEFNIEPIIARPMLEPKFPQFFRTEKYNLRRIIKDENGIYFPKTIAVSKCPDDIDKIWWEQFIENEYSLKKIEQRKKNAENKALHTITHTLGRKSYNRVYNDLKEEKSGKPGTRSEAWKRAHISKATGEVHPCAREKYIVASTADIIKVRMQADSRLHHGLQPRYSGIFDAFEKIIRTEGFLGLWKGVFPNAQRAVLVNMGELAFYDQAKQFIVNHQICGDNAYAHTLASVASGLSATALSCPADVIKTRMMSQAAGKGELRTIYRSSYDCLVKTVKFEGVMALWKGFLPTWGRLGPWQFVFWVSYEKFRQVSGLSSF